MANEVKIRVTASSDADAVLAKTKAEEDALGKSTEDVGKKAKATKLSIDDLAQSFRQMHTDDFGQTLNKDANFAGYLDAEVKKLTEHATLMRSEFNKTGNQSFLKDLEKTIGDIENITKQARQSGMQIGDSMAQGASESFKEALPMGMNPVVLGVGLGLATVLTPLIVGAITTAVVTGAGAGMLALGAVIEANDSSVRTAFSKMTGDIKAEFTRAASGLEVPLIKSLQNIDSFLGGFEDTFHKAFDSAAKGAGSLTHDLEGMLRPILNELPHLTNAFAKAFADPEVEKSLAGIGKSLANLLGTMAASGSAVKETFIILNGILGVTVAIIDTLINVTNFFAAAMDKVGKFIDRVAEGSPRMKVFMDTLRGWAEAAGVVGKKSDDLANATDRVGQAAQDTAVDWASYSSALSATTQNLDTFTQTMVDKVLSAQLGMAQATLGWNQSVSNLSQTLKDNKHSLDETTQAGQNNVAAILAMVAANQRTYDAMIQSGAGADAAAAQYDKNTASLNAMLLKAGFSQSAIDGLIGSMKNVPDKVSADIAMNGLTQAINDLDDLIREIHGLPPRKDIDIYVNYRQTGQIGDHVGTTYTQKASGGPIAGLTTINERGPELARLPSGSMVYPAGQSAQMVAQMSAGTPQTIESVIRFEGNTDSALATAIMSVLNSGQVTISSRFVR